MSKYPNRVTNSEVARLYRPDGRGQPPEVVRSSGPGLPGHKPCDLLKEGLVGRALATTRAALEPHDQLQIGRALPVSAVVPSGAQSGTAR